MLYGLPYTNGTRILSIFVLLILLVCWYNYWIIKKFLLKNKKATLIVGAIIFLVAIFFLKNQSDYKSQASQAALLSYGNISVQDLLNKDSNGNGIPDWKETLYGLDPTKKETADGTPNSVVIERIEAANRANAGNAVSTTTSTNQPQTQTDKFSQELFSTVAALNQTGQVDQTTVDKISTSAVQQLQNPVQKKVFVIGDLNVTKDDSINAIKKYDKATDVIFMNAPTGTAIVQILQSSVDQNGDINSAELAKLAPIVSNLQTILEAMVKVEVSPSLSYMHLDIVNGLEKIIENLTDVEQVDKDPVAAMSAMSAYPDNWGKLTMSIATMISALQQELKN